MYSPRLESPGAIRPKWTGFAVTRCCAAEGEPVSARVTSAA